MYLKLSFLHDHVFARKFLRTLCTERIFLVSMYSMFFLVSFVWFTSWINRQIWLFCFFHCLIFVSKSKLIFLICSPILHNLVWSKFTHLHFIVEKQHLAALHLKWVASSEDEPTHPLCQRYHNIIHNQFKIITLLRILISRFIENNSLEPLYNYCKQDWIDPRSKQSKLNFVVHQKLAWLCTIFWRWSISWQNDRRENQAMHKNQSKLYL